MDKLDKLASRRAARIELRVAIAAQARDKGMLPNEEAIMLRLERLRRVRGDLDAQRLMRWAIGCPMSALARLEHIRAGEIAARVDASLAWMNIFSSSAQVSPFPVH